MITHCVRILVFFTYLGGALKRQRNHIKSSCGPCPCTFLAKFRYNIAPWILNIPFLKPYIGRTFYTLRYTGYFPVVLRMFHLVVVMLGLDSVGYTQQIKSSDNSPLSPAVNTTCHDWLNNQLYPPPPPPLSTQYIDSASVTSREHEAEGARSREQMNQVDG